MTKPTATRSSSAETWATDFNNFWRFLIILSLALGLRANVCQEDLRMDVRSQGLVISRVADKFEVIPGKPPALTRKQRRDIAYERKVQRGKFFNILGSKHWQITGLTGGALRWKYLKTPKSY